jgi:hypothetical protein
MTWGSRVGVLAWHRICRRCTPYCIVLRVKLCVMCRQPCEWFCVLQPGGDPLTAQDVGVGSATAEAAAGGHQPDIEAGPRAA